MSKLTFIILLLLFACKLHSQSPEDAIKKTAVAYESWMSTNQDIYTVLKDYKVICIGEMHGTREPAEFLSGLVRSFVFNKRTVIVGMEIPDKLMSSFKERNDSTGLSKTAFFTDKTVDGRASEAWFRAINDCSKLGVTFCFFDNSNSNRDEGMYEHLLSCYSSDSNSVILTLSGNIHNKMTPFNNSKTLGCYLKERFGAKVCSINHIYNSGTMFNRMADGLKVHSIPPSDGLFSKATGYKAYYLPNIFNINEYSGFFFTKKVTSSLPWAK